MKAAIVLQPLLGITNILQIAFNPYNVGNIQYSIIDIEIQYSILIIKGIFKQHDQHNITKKDVLKILGENHVSMHILYIIIWLESQNLLKIKVSEKKPKWG